MGVTLAGTKLVALAALGALTSDAAIAPAGLTYRVSRPGLSVLTYNVEGLPWPVRWGRDSKLARIGARLRQMRAHGDQPHVIVLQEAFTPAAKAIAQTGGYRYIVDGPDRDLGGAAATTPKDRAFGAAANSLYGETEGKWLDSGLRVGSDYPIVAVRRMAFPAYACAGFDCLANKGAVAVAIRVPGSAKPVVIVATHLNSHHSSHASSARTLYSYQRQLDALGAFVRTTIPADYPLVLAGDLNVGKRLDRRTYLMRSAATWRPGAQISVALDSCLADASCDKHNVTDLEFSYRRGRDWQFFFADRASNFRLKAMVGLFGHDAVGRMLSDHVGYVASYGIGVPTPVARMATR
ncbi:MAG TPA: endonuclease/exonuclease/phosphatase family protein [Sphingomonas sp.]|nr:endonuclease/exonuclease/phosphatase family protein [Sphingomonas sp.]